MRTLAIISHTEHYRDNDGQIVGLSSTVSEINHLSDIFDHIFHLAMLHEKTPPANTLAYTSDKITFIALPALGGPKLKDKLGLIFNAPSVIKAVRQTLDKADIFQFRAPTGIGVYIIPYLMMLRSKQGWFKYAGNWKQDYAPLAYKFQRWLLKKQNRVVTINGHWEDQPKQCLSFENPCLTAVELQEGANLITNKTLENNKFHLCFIGRLEDAKGIGNLIKALSRLETKEQNGIIEFHVVGEGTKRKDYEASSSNLRIHTTFYGLLGRSEVHKIYKKCHAIILPSASEGFPKVIAEAMNYGCLPVVSDVSSISEYVKDGVNGFLCHPEDNNNLLVTLNRLLCLSNEQYVEMIKSTSDQHEKFSFSYYNNRIQSEILIDQS